MSTAQNAELAHFDVQGLLRTVEGDQGLAKELCRLFVQQSHTDMDGIRAAVEVSDAETLGRALHRLKGASAAVAASRVAALADDFGVIARSRDWQRVPEMWLVLQRAVEETVSAMSAYLENGSSEPT